MTIYQHPMLRRRSKRDVAAWMTALYFRAGAPVAFHAWLTELVSSVAIATASGAAS